MALDLGLTGVLVSSGIATIAALLVSYGIAGWYERRSRRRRERRLAEKRAARAGDHAD